MGQVFRTVGQSDMFFVQEFSRFSHSSRVRSRVNGKHLFPVTAAFA